MSTVDFTSHPPFAAPQYVPWVARPSATRPGKVDKIPLDWRTGRPGDAQDPALWLTYDAARMWADALGRGIGFVLTEAAGIWCIDLDECLTPQGWSGRATEVASRFPGAYIEVSHSGRGLHIFGTGPVPPHRTRAREGGLELYSHSRFIALTGTGAVGDATTRHPEALAWIVAQYFEPDIPPPGGAEEWRDGPVPEWSGPADDDTLIARMLAAPVTGGAAFGARASIAALWHADPVALGRAFPHPDREYDASSADSALASHLAYYTGSDCERMQRLMLRSGLVRDKWDARPDYLPRTITFAASRTTRWLRDAPPTLPRPASTSDSPASPGGGIFLAAATGGLIPATIQNVSGALRSAEGGTSLAYDTFLDTAVFAGEGGKMSPVDDLAQIRLREQFGLRGFKPIGAEMMRDAIYLVSRERQIDSAVAWAESLRWDGIPRIDTCMREYFGAPDTPYARAVGAYLWTALAGRCLAPGCQADMALILVDPSQGTRKTSAVAALAPWPDAFAEADLNRIDHDDSKRLLRGKLVIELSELKGLSGRDHESIKSWVSRRTEEWIEKYERGRTRFARRCILIGTSNREDLLSDPTGNRRWLPIHTGRLDADALARDRDQLWAEGIARWRASGIAWQAAQDLAKAEHARFEEVDDRDSAVAEWLARPEREGGPGDRYFPSLWVWVRALGGQSTSYGKREQMVVAKLLKSNGCVRNRDTSLRTWKRGGEVA